MEHIVYVLINVLSFIVCLLTLEVVWANVKGYWQEKNYLRCALYVAGGIIVFVIVGCLSAFAHTHFN